MDEREYLLEWPPPHSPNYTSPVSKKRKVSSETQESHYNTELIEESTEASTQSLLAKWWKRNGGVIRRESAEFCIPKSKNPNTIIHSITK